MPKTDVKDFFTKKNISVFCAALFLVSMPFLASAQSSFDAKCMLGGGCWGPLITCTGDYASSKVNPNGVGLVPHAVNPATGQPTPTCNSVCDLAVLVNTWIFFAYTIIVYILLPLGVAFGGFVWLTSAGNEERVSMARGIFKKTFSGLAIATVVVLAVGFIISSIGIGASNDSAKKGGGLSMSIVCNPNSDTIKVLDPNLNVTPTNT
jgi:hypothetical protein